MEKRTTKKKAEGLGDTVAQITKATGIDKLVKFVAGEDCGCDARKEKLNALFPYRTPKCLTEDEYTYLTESNVLTKQTIKPSEQDAILKIYNRIFGISREPTSCATCWMEIINKMQKVYNEYITE
jgi:predicted Zn-ribbon and HTH transcriptional regulator